MDTNLKVIKVLHLVLSFGMEFDNVLHELFIISTELFTVFLQVEDGSSLALDLVNVSVVDTSYFVTELRPLVLLSLVCLSGLCLLLDSSKSWLDTEVIVTTLLLPEALQIITNQLLKSEFFACNGKGSSGKFV
jgi:hypothetical protein